MISDRFSLSIPRDTGHFLKLPLGIPPDLNWLLLAPAAGGEQLETQFDGWAISGFQMILKKPSHFQPQLGSEIGDWNIASILLG